MPGFLHEIPGFTIATHYTPARRAGGDYYDLILQSDGTWCVLVADVSGHGPRAAVVMAMLRAIIHTFPGPADSPARLLEYGREHLRGGLMADQFVTALFGILDPRRGSFCLSSAGHEPPLLFDAQTGAVRKLAVEPGFPLGLPGEESFEQNTIELHTGDVLVLYTDGISESADAERKMFGEDRLVRILREHASRGAETVRDQIIAQVTEFSGGKLLDDRTLVILERL